MLKARAHETLLLTEMFGYAPAAEGRKVNLFGVCLFTCSVVSSVSHTQMDGQLPIQIWAVLFVLSVFLKIKKRNKRHEVE